MTKLVRSRWPDIGQVLFLRVYGPRRTEGTVFPNMDRPKPPNNVFIFFSLESYFIRNICVDFLLKQFHTVRVRLTFRSSKPVLFTKYLKEEIQFSLILELGNEGFTFHADF